MGFHDTAKAVASKAKQPLGECKKQMKRKAAEIQAAVKRGQNEVDAACAICFGIAKKAAPPPPPPPKKKSSEAKPSKITEKSAIDEEARGVPRGGVGERPEKAETKAEKAKEGD